MIPKCWKHDPLPPMVQMKETVPREDAMKSLRETKLPHIRHHRTLTHESMRSHLTKQNAATGFQSEDAAIGTVAVGLPALQT